MKHAGPEEQPLFGVGKSILSKDKKDQECLCAFVVRPHPSQRHPLPDIPLSPGLSSMAAPPLLMDKFRVLMLFGQSDPKTCQWT